MLKIATIALVSSFALSAFAANSSAPERSVELKDGTTVHVFRDGKMGMEDKFGRPFLMSNGHVMEARDGTKIQMKGNEVWRVAAPAQLYRGN
ncbi:CopK family periplasmic copper-binding protein [Aromatoleum petrolei]|uniref:CopK family periplasmic copper-binding protein n=1 Tax=Aromatoleum petrolei TaxID=76116 RepID=A0ABX1MXT8_9RHOO|nr:CopK family periplasmic copper-binding protein [Aromatoleum petrolei]NMF89877.1 CopK family periplasmic copper-binding protein [Aromatoleum petrolei]QTQ34490.1 Putative copper resistance protein [Aromatoleum petrolei]